MGSEMFDYLRHLSLFCPSTRVVAKREKNQKEEKENLRGNKTTTVDDAVDVLQ
jgi:hypothetical protein